VSRPKNAAVKDIDDISISSTFGGHKHRQRIDIGKRNMDPSLLINTKQNNLAKQQLTRTTPAAHEYLNKTTS